MHQISKIFMVTYTWNIKGIFACGVLSMNSAIFNKTSLDKVNSPEQLNDYIRVSNPGIFVVLAAVFVLLAAAAVWSVTWELPTSISAVGVAEDGRMICYLSTENAQEVQAGMEVEINGENAGKVLSVSEEPLSAAEVTASLNSDYLAYLLSLSGWNMEVIIDATDLEDGKLYSVSIVTDKIRPIGFLLN